MYFKSEVSKIVVRRQIGPLSNKINENLKVTLIMYKFLFKKIEAKLVVLDIQNSFAKPFFAKKAL